VVPNIKSDIAINTLTMVKDFNNNWNRFEVINTSHLVLNGRLMAKNFSVYSQLYELKEATRELDF
jgi:hypothetical protein